MKYLFLTLIYLTSSYADYSSQNVANQLGLTYNDYTFLMSLSGLIVGNLIFITLLIITIRVASK
jgi:hypothetical protein